jgi:hypothetical protein
MYFEATPLTIPIVSKAAADKGLNFEPVDALPPNASLMPLKKVRIGLWDTYGGSMPSGWTRWIFEQYEFPFEVVFPQTLDAGNLNSKFDVLVFVDGGIPMRDAAAGGGGGGGFGGGQPAADSIPAEFRGWLGRVTVAKTVPELKKFVENGGTILAIGSSTAIGEHLGLPIRDALVERVAGGEEQPLPREKFYIPGTILEARIDPTHPLAYGMEDKAMVMMVPPFSANFFSSGTVFETVTRPSHGRNSAGIDSGAGCAPNPPPPAAAGSRSGMPPSTNTSTSYFAFRLPASSVCG